MFFRVRPRKCRFVSVYVGVARICARVVSSFNLQQPSLITCLLSLPLILPSRFFLSALPSEIKLSETVSSFSFIAFFLSKDYRDDILFLSCFASSALIISLLLISSSSIKTFPETTSVDRVHVKRETLLTRVCY